MKKGHGTYTLSACSSSCSQRMRTIRFLISLISASQTRTALHRGSAREHTLMDTLGGHGGRAGGAGGLRSARTRDIMTRHLSRAPRDEPNAAVSCCMCTEVTVHGLRAFIWHPDPCHASSQRNPSITDRSRPAGLDYTDPHSVQMGGKRVSKTKPNAPIVTRRHCKRPSCTGPRPPALPRAPSHGRASSHAT